MYDHVICGYRATSRTCVQLNIAVILKIVSSTTNEFYGGKKQSLCFCLIWKRETCAIDISTLNTT